MKTITPVISMQRTRLYGAMMDRGLGETREMRLEVWERIWDRLFVPVYSQILEDGTS